MRIIETREDFDAFLHVVHRTPPILIPVFTDATLHPAAGNDLCLLGAVTPDETYGLPFNHSEAQNLPRSWLSELPDLVYTSNAADLHYAFPHQRWTGDLQALEYVATGSVTAGETFMPSVLRQLAGKYADHRHVYRALPLVKWMEYVQAYGAHLSGVLQAQREVVSKDPGYFFLATTGLPVLSAVEQSGLHVDPTVLHAHFPQAAVTSDDLVYSRYNLYSATGRPSCTWGGVNFAALNKTDGTRTAFTSRFPKGQMVLIDFEAYHLRLIADLLHYDLPAGSVHEYFGQQYFHTTALTPEQYDESKRRSFFALYSDADAHLPFFQQVVTYRKQLWGHLAQNGCWFAPHRTLWLNRLTDPAPAKAFNYLVQWLETERNLRVLRDVLSRFGQARAQSKVVLYTYDALLIDYNVDDGPDLLRDTVALLEGPGRKFPVRVYHGPNYGDLTRLTLPSRYL